jgi:restriction endonuclease S subunit
LGYNIFKKIKIPVPSQEDQEKIVKMIQDIEKEDSKYKKQLQTLKLQ